MSDYEEKNIIEFPSDGYSPDEELESAVRDGLNHSFEAEGIKVSDELLRRTLETASKADREKEWAEFDKLMGEACEDLQSEDESNTKAEHTEPDRRAKRRWIYRTAVSIAAAGIIGVVGFTVIRNSKMTEKSTSAPEISYDGVNAEAPATANEEKESYFMNSASKTAMSENGSSETQRDNEKEFTLTEDGDDAPGEPTTGDESISKAEQIPIADDLVSEEDLKTADGGSGTEEEDYCEPLLATGAEDYYEPLFGVGAADDDDDDDLDQPLIKSEALTFERYEIEWEVFENMIDILSGYSGGEPAFTVTEETMPESEVLLAVTAWNGFEYNALKLMQDRYEHYHGNIAAVEDNFAIDTYFVEDGTIAYEAVEALLP